MERCILNVEDDQDSIFFLKLAFKKAGVSLPLVTVEDGEQATNYLFGLESYADRKRHPLPALVLLDIHLPKRTGFEILELIRKTPAIKELPVIMLTTSGLAADILKSRELGADHYLVKPPDVEKLGDMIRMIYERWLAPFSNLANTASKSSGVLPA